MGKLLASQLKEKSSSNTIPVIKQGDAQFFAAKDINSIFQQYYDKLYTSSISPNASQADIEQFLQEAAGLESPITEAEIRKAILSMENGKSPGYDGLPLEYYKTFADIVVPVLQRVYQEIFDKGRVAPTFNEASHRNFGDTFTVGFTEYHSPQSGGFHEK